MKLFGKTIATDKINFAMNIISFVLGSMFFLRMQYKAHDSPALPATNADHDSLIKIQTRVSTQLREIKSVQDSIAKSIGKEKSVLQVQEKRIDIKRAQVYSTIHSEWDDLSPKSREAYVDKLLGDIKKNKST